VTRSVATTRSATGRASHPTSTTTDRAVAFVYRDTLTHESGEADRV
jgi:hypothetical protein